MKSKHSMRHRTTTLIETAILLFCNCTRRQCHAEEIMHYREESLFYQIRMRLFPEFKLSGE